MRLIVCFLALAVAGLAQTSSGSGNATRLQGRPIATTAPTTGQVLCWISGTTWGPCAAASASLGGASGTVQYNNSGAFGGVTSSVVSGSTVQLTTSDATTGASDAPGRPIVAAHVTSAVPIEVDTGLAGFKAAYQWKMTKADGTLPTVMTIDSLWRDPTNDGFATAATVGYSLQFGSMAPFWLNDDWNADYAFGGSSGNYPSGGSNTRFGGSIMAVCTTCHDNSGFGSSSLNSMTTGDGNVGFGNYACQSATTGGDNVCLGWKADVLAATDDNETVIGYNLKGHGPNTVTMGNSAAADWYTPAIMHVGGTASASLNFPSIPDGTSADLTFTLTGAAIGDRVAPGLPTVVTAASGINCQMAVSATNTIQVRCLNLSGAAVDLAAATFGATILK